ncbi:alpha/beta fold hydrolase [Alkalibacterium kapii]|uniref:alpha/beta fold hydrolase n=1 Tax=Alkalibacterium kapii TaxID=426704 RepID=UPI001649DE7E|nr:alpha/beta fold hydrolase [Alkalibacterium kapii]
MKNKKSAWKKWLLGIGIFLILLIVSAILYLRFNTYQAMPEATVLLEDEAVSHEEDWISITPENVSDQIVLYPGGLVETAAYLPLAKDLSSEGYQVFIPDMPLNLAILNTDIIDEIKEANPSDKNWWLAGHSLGGASAAIYADDQDEEVKGLILLAAYPSDETDLSESSLNVLSITGSKDGIMDTEQFVETKELLPEETTYVEIAGGNHSNFGSYGFQEGDKKSDLTREEQQGQIVQLISDFILNQNP